MLAAIIQAVYYIIYAMVYKSAFYTVEVESRLRHLIAVSLAVVFVNTVTPTVGSAGIALFVNTGSSSTIKYISYEEAYGEGFEDMKRRVPDISKIHSLIGWQPEVRLEELLQKIIAYKRVANSNVQINPE